MRKKTKENTLIVFGIFILINLGYILISSEHRLNWYSAQVYLTHHLVTLAGHVFLTYAVWKLFLKELWYDITDWVHYLYKKFQKE